ncbi:adenosylcobinamide-GDP ribazoletransferase [Oryzibacter oryziterrae]|uniref:adenosylcobinamide-GDP ribazoletransferase n=1 Tax=Oryzibacter oryziterrae TaxID=2766474 RepID=UPI001F02D744|nr:adenosylcobinamide-GDP ribazoletransferase [Oryzibacter oryziterrae]
MSLRTVLIRIADLAACLRFFSRLPIPRLMALDDPMAPPALPRAAAMIPIAGSIIALPAALLLALLAITSLPPLAIGFLAVAVLVTPTGGLHEDGLADTADGLFGGHDKERRLAIMKDSRIGAFGALALIVVLGLKASLIGGLAETGAFTAFAVLLGGAAVSRLAVVGLWAALPPARSNGLSASFMRPNQTAFVQAAIAALAACLPAVFVLDPGDLLLGLALAAAITLVVGLLARSKIGGQTGDILGAVQVLAEAAFLLGILV